MKLWYLFRIELISGFWQLKRYPFDVVTGIISLGGIFFLLLGAGQVVAGATPSKEGVTNLIITYILGFSVLAQVSAVSQMVSRESKSGMLEQLFLSGHALPTILMMRSLAGLVSSFSWIGLMLAILSLLTGTGIQWSLALLIPIAPMLAAALGLGLMLAAITLLLKDIGGIFGILQLPLMLLAGFGVPVAWWQYILPAASSAGIFRGLALGQAVPLEVFVLAFASAGLWLGLGVLVFQAALKMAQQRGILGHE